jgi:beta-phosphoglucomutase
MIKAVIFDLDGVIVSTDENHFRAWKQLADDEGIPFTRQDNERLRGVSRMASLEIVLENSATKYSHAEKVEMTERKNKYYRESLKGLSPKDILSGVLVVLEELRKRGVKVAIGSSSKNAKTILQAVGLGDAFDIVVDGTHISQSKPDPEVFAKAGIQLGIPPEQCLVVEDAEVGVDAGLAAGMPVLAVGSAAAHTGAVLAAVSLEKITVDEMLRGR